MSRSCRSFVNNSNHIINFDRFDENEWLCMSYYGVIKQFDRAVNGKCDLIINMIRKDVIEN